MDELNFDPHYLADYHIKKYSKYFGLDLVNVTFAVYGPDNNLITYWG